MSRNIPVPFIGAILVFLLIFVLVLVSLLGVFLGVLVMLVVGVVLWWRWSSRRNAEAIQG